MTKGNIITYLNKAMQLSTHLDYDIEDRRPPKVVKDYDRLVQHLSMLIMVLEMEEE